MKTWVIRISLTTTAVLILIICIWLFGHRQLVGFDMSAHVDIGWKLASGQEPYQDFPITTLRFCHLRLCTKLYLYTKKSQPVKVAGFGEIIQQRYVEIINQYLADPPPIVKIYWDQRFYDINLYNYVINPYDFPTLVSRELSTNKHIVLFSARK